MTTPSPLAELELPVRPLSQHALHPTEEKNRACWYTAAVMVLSHRGPLEPLRMMNVQSLARKYVNRGLLPMDFAHFAREAGLEQTTAQALLPRNGPADWRNALDTRGPLIVVSDWHTLVVRGIVRKGLDWHIVSNNPHSGARETAPINAFNYYMDRKMPIWFRR